MPLPPYLTVQSDLVLLHVKAQPRASRNEVGAVLGGELKIKTTAPPVDSAANEALARFLADVLGCPRGAIQLARGQSSRHKTFTIRGVDATTIHQKLQGESPG